MPSVILSDKDRLRRLLQKNNRAIPEIRAKKEKKRNMKHILHERTLKWMCGACRVTGIPTVTFSCDVPPRLTVLTGASRILVDV
jgi:hypothetical protein